jgi:hypothetical protein
MSAAASLGVLEMSRRFVLPGLLALAGAAHADMYQDGSNAKLPEARTNLAIAPHVATNADLAASATASYPNGVVRDDYSAGRGAPPLYYRPSAVACSISGGDGGSQVPSSDGKCWLAAFDTAGASIMEWGPVGDGVAPDYTPVKNAFAWADTSGIPLLMDNAHKFLIVAGIVSTGNIDVRGASGHVNTYAANCPGGAIVANSDITALTFNGPSGSVRSICVQMAPVAGTRLSGAGIVVGTANAGQGQGHFHLSESAVINAYDGILIGAAIAGAPQTNTPIVENNLVVSASHYAIGLGVNSTGASSPGVVISHNQIICIAANSNSTGYAVFDGAFHIAAGDEGPYNCAYGTQVLPGNNQIVGGTFTGVLGDSSLVHDLWVHPTSAGAYMYSLNFDGSWTSSVNGPDQSVLIENTVGALWGAVKFVGHTFFAVSGATSPLVKIDAANVIITGGHFIVNGFTLNTGLELGAHSTLTAVSNNLMSAVNGGALTNGIKIDSGASVFTIQGNSFLFTTNPIVYTPNAETALIKDNIGVDNTCPSVASAASISLPNAATCVNITGSTAIKDITNSTWSGRSVLLQSQNGVALNTGGAAATQFCTAATLAPFASKTVVYNTVAGCWAPL